MRSRSRSSTRSRCSSTRPSRFAASESTPAWAVRSETSREAQRVPAVALLTPLVPLLLYYALHMEAAVAFLVAAVFGVLVTRPAIAVQRLVASAIRGVEDVAPAVLLFMGIGMLLVATQQPQFAAALRPLVAGDWLRNPIAFVLVFGAASPLALYRGPLNPFGVGIAIFTVLLTSHVLPPVVLVAAIMAVVQVQNVCDPTNTSNVWVANFTGVPIATITRRTLPYQVAVALLGTLLIVVGAPALFGERVFAPLASIARADETLGGILCPAVRRRSRRRRRRRNGLGSDRRGCGRGGAARRRPRRRAPPRRSELERLREQAAMPRICASRARRLR